MEQLWGKQLHLKGHGDGLYVELEPSDGAGGVRLGPVLPGTENCIQELFLVNPTEYTIEVSWIHHDSSWFCKNADALMDVDGCWSTKFTVYIYI